MFAIHFIPHDFPFLNFNYIDPQSSSPRLSCIFWDVQIHEIKFNLNNSYFKTFTRSDNLAEKSIEYKFNMHMYLNLKSKLHLEKCNDYMFHEGKNFWNNMIKYKNMSLFTGDKTRMTGMARNLCDKQQTNHRPTYCY